MKKIISIIILSLLLTGCSAEYNLVINTDLTAKETNKIFSLASEVGENYASPKAGIIARINNNYYTDQFNKYSYEIFEKDEYAGAIFSRSYENLEEWSNSRFVTNIFYPGEIDENENIITITFKLNKEDGYLADIISDPDFYLSPVIINIKLKFKIIFGNYDTISNNILTWNYTSLNKKEELTFSFDKTQLSDGTKIDIINNNSSNITENSKFDILYILIGFFGIMFLGTLIIYIIYRNKNKI